MQNTYKTRILLQRIAGLLAIASASFETTAVASAQNVVPYQYIAKMYTEAMGSAPTAANWLSHVNYFVTNGCTAGSLKGTATTNGWFFDSPAFFAYNPDAQSQVIAMYRSILNRDPDSSAYSSGGYYDQLVTANQQTVQANRIAAIVAVANEIFNGITNDVASICSATNPDYGTKNVGPQAPPTVLSSGLTPVGVPDTALPNALKNVNCGNGNQVITLAQATLFLESATVLVPGCVTLETYGTPLPTNYTQMARIARQVNFVGPLIQVTAGGVVKSLWVDGQRNVLGYYKTTNDNANIETEGGTTSIVNVKSVETQGGSNLKTQGIQIDIACTKATVTGNLVTGYATNHAFPVVTGEQSTWIGPADGITNYCENADIENNSIVDQTDIAIVIMGTSKAGVNQASTIKNNTIVSAGNSMNAAISTDPQTAENSSTMSSYDQYGDLAPNTADGQQYPCYKGTTFTTNTFWSGGSTGFVFGIEAGGRAFQPVPQLFNGQCTGTTDGPTYTNNGTGPNSANVIQGVSVGGILNATITNDGTTDPLTVTTYAPGTANTNGLVIFSTSNSPGMYCNATKVEMELNDSTPADGPTATSTAGIDSCTFSTKNH